LLLALICLLAAICWIELFDSIKHNVQILPDRISARKAGQATLILEECILVKNQTGRRVAIKKLLLSCGCMSAVTKNTEMQSNGSTEIHFRIEHQNSSLFRGSVEIVFVNLESHEQFSKVIPVRIEPAN